MMIDTVACQDAPACFQSDGRLLDSVTGQHVGLPAEFGIGPGRVYMSRQPYSIEYSITYSLLGQCMLLDSSLK